MKGAHAVVAVIAALLSTVDIASKALAARLVRVREARTLFGLSWLQALRVSGLPVIAGGAALTEGPHTAEFVVAESPGTISRDKVTVTVPANTTYKPGLVLGRITATGKYVAYNNGAADGSEVAAGVLYGELRNETGAAADKAGVILNWSCEVRKVDLDWNGQAQAAIDAGLADLLTKGVKAR